MIQKIEVRNFPYIGDLKIETTCSQSDMSVMFGDVDYVTSNIIITDEDVPIDGFDILALFLCALTLDMRGIMSTYFKAKPAFVYLDYVVEGVTYRYSAVITNNGFIKETLHELVDGLSVPIKLDKVQSPVYASCIPLFYETFFSELVYFNYIVIDSISHLKSDIESGKLLSYLEMVDEGSKLYDNYMCNLVDMIRMLGMLDLKDIAFSGKDIQIYYENEDDSKYKHLWQQTESFVNAFFLAISLLESLLYGKIIFITGIDRYSEKLAARVYQIFEQRANMVPGSQLFMSCYPQILNRVNATEGQVFRTIKQLSNEQH